MKKFKDWAAFFSALCLLPSALAVSCGDFVKIYDPSVGEKEHWYVNDRCFIRAKDGTWHLFGITRQEPARPMSEIHFAPGEFSTLGNRA